MHWTPAPTALGTPKVPAPLRVAVLVCPAVTLGTLGALTDPLLLCNQLGGQRFYELHWVSLDGQAVKLSGGRRLSVDGSLAELTFCEALIVAGDAPPSASTMALSTPTLKRLAQTGVALGASRGGLWWLAEAGVLNQRRVAAHWEDMPVFRERYPNIILCTTLFELDGDRFTASSPMAALDMMLSLVVQHTGPEHAETVASAMGAEHIRGRQEKQKVPARHSAHPLPQPVVEALELMESNLEDPLGTTEIAQCVQLSRRQLERLFKQHLNELPSRHYLNLRLERARQLVRRSAKGLVQIGLDCGFSSGSHFASAYRKCYGLTPREDRARMRQNPVGHGS